MSLAFLANLTAFPLSNGLLPGDQVYIYTAGAYTTCYASSFNGFGPPTTHCLP